jgi:hypothetical protein
VDASKSDWLALNGASQDPDPIFAAIEAHKKAYAELSALLDRHSDLEERLAAEVEHLRHDPPERYRQLKALQAATPEWTASERELDIFHAAETEAVCGMIEVRPSTLAGAAALMRYVVEQERIGNEWPTGLEDAETGFDNEDWVTFLHRNVAETIEAAAA